MAAACVRQAWLDLYGDGSVIMPLEGVGYFCTSLDLGYPAVREVINNKPDQNGADDRTSLFGSRVVSADITALAGAGARIDAVWSGFAPYMVVTARPVLHYILDRPGAGERVITLRPAGFSGPIVGPNQRDIQLQFVAADPAIKDPATKTVIAMAGSSTNPGRNYNRTYPLVYPVGGSSSTIGLMAPAGDLAVRPKLRIYGPITAPKVTFAPAGAGQQSFQITFQQFFTVTAGNYVEVDCYDKTVRINGDPQQPAEANLDWQHTSWPIINPVPPAAAGVNITLLGSSTSVVTQAQAIWQDRYLT